MCISACRCLWLHVLCRTYGSQRTICGTFSPAAMWFPGTELKSSGLVTDVFTHWTILLVPHILEFLFWNRVLLSYPGWLWTHSVVNCRPWTFHPSASFSWVVGIAGPLPCPVRENICVKVSIQEPGVMPFLICLAHSSREGSPSGPGKRNGPWSQTETTKMEYQFKIFFLFLFLFSPGLQPTFRKGLPIPVKSHWRNSHRFTQSHASSMI